MQLFLDSFGAFLGVRNGMFWVRPRHGEGRAIAVRELQAVFLNRGVSVSADALMLAIREGIPVLLIDAIGHPVGQVWSGRFGSIATIRKNQALFAIHSEGLSWVREVLLQKIDRQRLVLRTLPEGKHLAPEFPQRYYQAITIIGQMEENLLNWQPERPRRSDADAATLRGWEGTASRYYFQCLSAALPEPYRFANRSKRPAFDAFNALINYLYGMLYAMVELALMKAGLDPYTGVLHADEYNRPTLVFDVIELYRHWVETVAISLCQNGQLPTEDAFIESPEGGIWLGKAGKGLVINTFLHYMDEKITYEGQSRRRITHIDLDAIRLATNLKTYAPEPM